MASAVIGALRVVLGVDSAALTSGLQNARGQFAEFGSAVATAATAAAAAITAAYAAAAVGVTGAINKMDQIGKQSQKIGIPVEQLSAMALAADLADVNMETLTKSLGKFGKAMIEAVANPTSEAGRAFKALGIDAAQAAKNPQEALLQVADKMANLKDSTAKTTASLFLFGRAGQEMLPFLNQGRDGITKIMEEAKKLGVVFDKDTADKAEKFNDTIKKLTAAKEGLFIKLATYVLPALQLLSQRFLDNASNAQKQESRLDFLKGAFDALAKGVIVLADNMALVGKLFLAFIGYQIASTVVALTVAFVNLAIAIRTVGISLVLLDILKAIGPRIGAIVVAATAGAALMSETVREKLGDLAKWIGGALGTAIETLGGKLSGLNTQYRETADTTSSLESSWGNAAKEKQELNARLLAGKDAFDKYIDTQKKALAANLAESQTMGLAAGAQERVKVILQGLALAKEKGIKLSTDQMIALTEEGNAAEQAKLKLEGLKLIYENLTPVQKYNIELANMDVALKAAGASAEVTAEAHKKLDERFQVSSEALAANVANTMGSLSQLTAVFGKENKKMAVLSKAFAITQAIINTAVAISKANTLLPPASYVAMAAAGAAGAAQIATIMAQQVATGGSFKVPGGMSHQDSVFTPLMLSPGEQVDIWRPGQGGPDPRGGGRGGEVVVRGISPRDFVTGDMLRSMVDGLNAAYSDGYKLRFAE